MFLVHGCGAYVESSVVIVDGVVLPRALVLVHCVLQRLGSELGVKQSDAILAVRSGFRSVRFHVKVPV